MNVLDEFGQAACAYYMDFMATLNVSLKPFANNALGTVRLCSAISFYEKTPRGKYFLEHVKENTVVVTTSVYNKASQQGREFIFGKRGVNSAGFILKVVPDAEIPAFFHGTNSLAHSDTIDEDALIRNVKIRPQRGNMADWVVNSVPGRSRKRILHKRLLSFLSSQLLHKINLPSLVHSPRVDELCVFEEESTMMFFRNLPDVEVHAESIDSKLHLFCVFTQEQQDNILSFSARDTRVCIAFRRPVVDAVKLMFFFSRTCMARKGRERIFDYEIVVYPEVSHQLRGLIYGRVHTSFTPGSYLEFESKAKKWFSGSNFFRLCSHIWLTGGYYVPQKRGVMALDQEGTFAHRGKLPGIPSAHNNFTLSSITCAMKWGMMMSYCPRDGNNILLGGCGPRPPIKDVLSMRKVCICVDVDPLITSQISSTAGVEIFTDTLSNHMQRGINYGQITLFNCISATYQLNIGDGLQFLSEQDQIHLVNLARSKLTTEGVILLNYPSPFCSPTGVINDATISVEDSPHGSLTKRVMTIVDSRTRVYTDYFSRNVYDYLSQIGKPFGIEDIPHVCPVTGIPCRYEIGNHRRVEDITSFWSWFAITR
jgi:hypothetical protein